jgi:hypothetical protein
MQSTGSAIHDGFSNFTFAGLVGRHAAVGQDAAGDAASL